MGLSRITLGTSGDGKPVEWDATHPLMITGESGSGKTVEAKNIATQALEQGWETIVLSAAPDYPKDCKWYNLLHVEEVERFASDVWDAHIRRKKEEGPHVPLLVIVDSIDALVPTEIPEGLKDTRPDVTQTVEHEREVMLKALDALNYLSFAGPDSMTLLETTQMSIREAATRLGPNLAYPENFSVLNMGRELDGRRGYSYYHPAVDAVVLTTPDIADNN